MSSLVYPLLTGMLSNVVFQKLEATDWTAVKTKVRFGCSTDTVSKTIERYISSVLLNLGEQQCASGWENLISPFLPDGLSPTTDRFSNQGWLVETDPSVSQLAAFVIAPIWSNAQISIATVSQRITNVGLNATGHTYMITSGPSDKYNFGLGFSSVKDDKVDAINAFSAIEGSGVGLIRLAPVWRIGSFQSVFFNAIAIPVVSAILKAQDFSASNIYSGPLVTISLNGQSFEVPSAAVLPVESAYYGVSPSLIVPDVIIPPPLPPPPPPAVIVPPAIAIPPTLIIPYTASTDTTTLTAFIVIVVLIVVFIVVTIIVLGFVSIRR